MILEGDRRFDVVVRLDDALRNDPAIMQQLPVMREDEEAGALTNVYADRQVWRRLAA